MQATTTDHEKAAAYYKAAATNARPMFVPVRIRIVQTVRGDGMDWNTRVAPGEYDCSCNQYGAVSVKASNGRILGVRLTEFEPVAWAANHASL